MSWNEPYFEEIPEGIYTVFVDKVELNQKGDKAVIEIGGVVVNDPIYAGAPLSKQFWLYSDFGERQLKGAVNKVVEAMGQDVSPTSHLIAGDNPFTVKEWLHKHLFGGHIALRVEDTISPKDGKTYKNQWFHGVDEIAKPSDIKTPF